MQSILNLDSDSTTRFILFIGGETVRCTHLSQIDPGGDVYEEASPELLEVINELLFEANIDLVIIGNNGGAGLSLAKGIDEDLLYLKERTVVVSNYGLSGEEEAAYRELGLTNFCTRAQLKEFLQVLVPQLQQLQDERDAEEMRADAERKAARLKK
jgi:hypothetical protein